MEGVRYNFYIDKVCEKETRAACGRKYFCDVDLHVGSFENALVLPGDNLARGGVLVNGELMPHSSYHRGVGGVYDFVENEVAESDEEVVYVGMWPAVWGHCLTDNVKHLWFIFYPEYDYLKRIKWVFSPIWGNFPQNHNFWKLLEKWGIDLGNIYSLDKPTRFKKVFLPDDCFIASPLHGKVYTKEFARLYDNLTIPTPIKSFESYEKVYFTRTAFFDGRKDFGEKNIENVFREMGYKILSPEKLELDELIYVLRNCKVLASTEGSTSHNALFLNEGAELVLIRKAYYVNGYQLPINEMKKLKVTIIDSHKSVAVGKNDPWQGPFFLYCGRNLKRFAPGAGQERFPIVGFLEYLIKTKYFNKLIKRFLRI